MQEATGIEFIPMPTPQLKAMVERYRATLSPELYSGLIKDLKSMYLKYDAVLAGYPAGPERARAAHRLINAPIQQSTVPPTCTKGCGACCHLEVEITKDEGELLAQVVKEGASIDRRRLATQAARARRSADWGLPIQADSRCVFLGDDQACRIYEARPSICRKHVVASDPAACMTEGGQPLPILIPMAELVLSAALSQPGNTYASLSKKLTEALSRQEGPVRFSESARQSSPVLDFNPL